MERENVIRHLRAWADGVDATTGAPIAPDHASQQPDTLRVVFAALALLEQTSSAGGFSDAPGAGLRAPPKNAGRPWSPEEDATLVSGFDAAETITALAARLGRTRGAINARLVKLGKIEMPPGLRLRGEADASHARSG